MQDSLSYIKIIWQQRVYVTDKNKHSESTQVKHSEVILRIIIILRPRLC